MVILGSFWLIDGGSTLDCIGFVYFGLLGVIL